MEISPIGPKVEPLFGNYLGFTSSPDARDSHNLVIIYFDCSDFRQAWPWIHSVMHALEVLQRAGGIVLHGAALGKNLVIFALRRARNVQQTVFHSSNLSLQAAILTINLCVLYGGKIPLSTPITLHTAPSQDLYTPKMTSIFKVTTPINSDKSWRWCKPPTDATVHNRCMQFMVSCAWP